MSRTQLWTALQGFAAAQVLHNPVPGLVLDVPGLAVSGVRHCSKLSSEPKQHDDPSRLLYSQHSKQKNSPLLPALFTSHHNLLLSSLLGVAAANVGQLPRRASLASPQIRHMADSAAATSPAKSSSLPAAPASLSPAAAVAGAAVAASGSVSSMPATTSFQVGPRKVTPLRRGINAVTKEGIVTIISTRNNTFVILCDKNGQRKTHCSSGMAGFKDAKKKTPLAAEKTAEKVALAALQMGYNSVVVRLKGIGNFKQHAVQALHAAGLRVSALMEVTGTPHNGCRPPRKKRKGGRH